MQLLPYILMILGIIFIVLSFVLPDKDEKEKQEITKKEHDDIIAQEQREIDGILQDKTDDVIEKVDEQLSRISNEKIISVSEYSDQVLEKINQNHQEVVFLYNMLNEKEEEMKKMMVKMKPTSKKDTPGEKQAEKLAKKAARTAREQEEEKAEAVPSVHENDDMEMLRDLLSAGESNVEEKDTGKRNTGKKEDGTGERHGNREPVDSSKKVPEKVPGLEESSENSISKKVLELYKDGMDVLEISRTLSRGRGEVQLIIDLYGRRRRG
jgi:hypothetical protein